MHRYARSMGVTVVTLMPLTTFVIGEVAEKYDNSNKVLYAKQRLLRWRDGYENKRSSEASGLKQIEASAWLSNAISKFPYLLSISSGDNLAIVINKLLQGANVLGSDNEPTYDTLKRLTFPASPLGLVAHQIATQYAALEAFIHKNVRADFDSWNAGKKSERERLMMYALLSALRHLQCSEQESKDSGEESGANAVVNSQLNKAIALPVFLLRDFDTLSDLEAEKWILWTHQVLSEGLAHVVIVTTAAVTPSKAKWLQTRHQSGLRAANLDNKLDFVCIHLRPAHGLVDDTTAKEKLHEIAKLHNLRLFPNLDVTSDDSRDNVDTIDRKTNTEIQVILEATGNWWSDIDVICQRLTEIKLNTVTCSEERLAMIHKVCDDFVQEIEMKLLESLHLNGSLPLPHNFATSCELNTSFLSDSDSTNGTIDSSKVLNAVGTWKCLETLADVVPITGGSFLVGSPQQLLDQDDKMPPNCVSPVDALLPFHYRKDGEQRFLDLIDQQLLFLRPKNAVNIGVIPCKPSASVSPCWVQTRPVVKKAFEKIHRNDTYFRAMLEIDRFAAVIEMRKEIAQYEQEIAERQKAFFDMKRDFTVLQVSMAPAEKAQRKAELALIDVELQAKDVYLEKLRSLQY